MTILIRLLRQSELAGNHRSDGFAQLRAYREGFLGLGKGRLILVFAGKLVRLFDQLPLVRMGRLHLVDEHPVGSAGRGFVGGLQHGEELLIAGVDRFAQLPLVGRFAHQA